jgi:phosphotransferase system HPr (HPr) family protein
MLFYRTAIQYGCEVYLLKNGNKYNGKSMLDLISMYVIQGDSFRIIAEGSDENEAITALLEQIRLDSD